MFDLPQLPQPEPRATAADLARRFVAKHQDGLATAAELLGGRPAFGRLLRFMDGLRRSVLSTRQIERELSVLLNLLNLEHVGDPDRDESALFAALDPDSEVATDMMRLTDELSDLLHRIRALPVHAAPRPARRAA